MRETEKSLNDSFRTEMNSRVLCFGNIYIASYQEIQERECGDPPQGELNAEAAFSTRTSNKAQHATDSPVPRTQNRA
jgi:hypothetical protein